MISRRTYKLVPGYPFLADKSNSVSLSSLLSTLEDIRSAQDERHERLLVEENDGRDSETVDEGGDKNRNEDIESEEKEMISNMRSMPEMISSSESSSESEDHRYEIIQRSEEQENESDSESEDHRYENIERPKEEPREEERKDERVSSVATGQEEPVQEEPNNGNSKKPDWPVCKFEGSTDEYFDSGPPNANTKVSRPRKRNRTEFSGNILRRSTRLQIEESQSKEGTHSSNLSMKSGTLNESNHMTSDAFAYASHISISKPKHPRNILETLTHPRAKEYKESIYFKRDKSPP